jgi:hypothetical protein
LLSGTSSAISEYSFLMAIPFHTVSIIVLHNSHWLCVCKSFGTLCIFLHGSNKMTKALNGRERKRCH